MSGIAAFVTMMVIGLVSILLSEAFPAHAWECGWVGFALFYASLIWWGDRSRANQHEK